LSPSVIASLPGDAGCGGERGRALNTHSRNCIGALMLKLKPEDADR
jgi:hypothetical protein